MRLTREEIKEPGQYKIFYPNGKSESVKIVHSKVNGKYFVYFSDENFPTALEDFHVSIEFEPLTNRDSDEN